MLVITVKNNKLYSVDNLYTEDVNLINELFDTKTLELKKKLELDGNNILKSHCYDSRPSQIVKIIL